MNKRSPGRAPVVHMALLAGCAVAILPLVVALPDDPELARRAVEATLRGASTRGRAAIPVSCLPG